jgi:PHD/YefM family antitoxin component YafN of YafNO toxin-antitoxin module
MADDSPFTTLDGSQIQSDLLELLCRTAQEKGRIEITNCGGTTCVIISKEELEDLETALEILSNTHEGRALHEHVQMFVKLDTEDDEVAPAVSVE